MGSPVFEYRLMALCPPDWVDFETMAKEPSGATAAVIGISSQWERQLGHPLGQSVNRQKIIAPNFQGASVEHQKCGRDGDLELMPFGKR